jgi:hypothetical protein
LTIIIIVIIIATAMIVFTGASSACFRTFRCERVGSVYYLQADYSLVCGTLDDPGALTSDDNADFAPWSYDERYLKYLIYAIFFTFVYPIGM